MYINNRCQNRSDKKMSVIKNWGLSLFLVVSVVVNIFFIINKYYSGNIKLREQHQLSWSRKAAEEAEAVAAVSCSGHGRAYVDGPLDSYGNPVCECNTCFYGSDCSKISSICTADAARSLSLSAHNPYFFYQNH